MIPNGFVPSQAGKKLSRNSSEESKWLYLILQAIERMNGGLFKPNSPVAFTVGTTTDAPVNGASTWTITAIDVANRNIKLLLDGVPMIYGTDYTFNPSTSVVTLLITTFATGKVYTVIY